MRVNTSKRNIGININNNGKAHARIWAPLAASVEIVLETEERFSLAKDEMGYWTSETPGLSAGSLYKIAVDGNDPFPDPVSLSQPHGVHGWSAVVDASTFHWTDHAWRNIRQEDYIIYELHTGTFSAQRNFEGIAEKLDYLKDLGITAIEIMPVGQFPGSRNWGYDGVFPFAVQHSYGGAHALQRLVNECHARGIAVILDVIYNHLGPEGNYLTQFGPYFTDKYTTPWGKSLNFDDAWCDGVREYFIENALMWFRDFHIDALRMDAVHAIKDFSATHIIKEIRQHVDVLTQETKRNYYLIAEMDLNDPVFINPYNKCGYGCDAQWIDEFHHALRVASGQPAEGYYSDFNGVAHLAKAYTDAYVYDGQFSNHRKKTFGKKTYNDGRQFVAFSQNHDQTGNRMLGERTSRLVSFEMCKLLAGAVMVSPYVPMLFMGEEWSEPNPFLFFISHTDQQLAAAVNKGRKEEFSYFNWQGEPPDPRLDSTFDSSMLQWELLEQEPHNTMHRYYRKLIQLRKTHPALRSTTRENVEAEADEINKVVRLQKWTDEQFVECLLNFSDKEYAIVKDEKFKYIKLFSSADAEWNGKSAANEETISPESIVIFERRPV